MSLREEQCKKVCRILDDVLANRPTERDSLIVAVRKAFAEPKRGKWNRLGRDVFNCNKCGATFDLNQGGEKMHFCPNCMADMRGEQDEMQ